jgi:hypothetical protein
MVLPDHRSDVLKLPAETRKIRFSTRCSASPSAYALALPQHSIWYRRRWATTMKSVFDGLIYGLITGAVFAWLWPK